MRLNTFERNLIKLCFYINLFGVIFFFSYIFVLITGIVQYIDFNLFELIFVNIYGRLIFGVISICMLIFYIYNLIYWFKLDKETHHFILLLFAGGIYVLFYYQKKLKQHLKSIVG